MTIAQAAGFALLHGITLGIVTWIGLYLQEVGFARRTALLLETFAEGAALGGFLAWIIATVIAGRRPTSSRFAAMLVCLVIGTAGGIALVDLIRFRVYYAAAHDNFPSVEWLIQLAFAGASVAYTLVASGLPLILPLGLIPLFAGSALFAFKPRG